VDRPSAHLVVAEAELVADDGDDRRDLPLEDQASEQRDLGPADDARGQPLADDVWGVGLPCDDAGVDGEAGGEGQGAKAAVERLATSFMVTISWLAMR